jgi:hypothetical protein
VSRGFFPTSDTSPKKITEKNYVDTRKTVAAAVKAARLCSSSVGLALSR